MKPNNNSLFKRGRGVFTCRDCGKKTRGIANYDNDCCRKCTEKGEHLNAHYDNQPPIKGGWDCCVDGCEYRNVRA